MQAVGNEIKTTFGARAYASLRKHLLMNFDSIRFKKKVFLINIAMSMYWIVDDIPIGKENSGRIFHTFQIIPHQNKQIIISPDVTA